MSDYDETQAAPEPAPEPAPVSIPDSERVRYEDDPARFPPQEGFEPAPLSADERPDDESRKDETSAMASDRYDGEGNRIQ